MQIVTVEPYLSEIESAQAHAMKNLRIFKST